MLVDLKIIHESEASKLRVINVHNGNVLWTFGPSTSITYLLSTGEKYAKENGFRIHAKG